MEATEVRVLELPEASFWESQGFGVLLGVVGGAALTLVVSLLLLCLQWRRSEKAQQWDLAALLMFFLDEFVEAFQSCVKYTRQHLGGKGVSFSTIYTPTDASMVAEFVRLCKEELLHEALFLLRHQFFQAASVLPRLADAVHRSEGLHPDDRGLTIPATDAVERERLRYGRLALQYRGAVAAFFLGNDPKNDMYRRIVVSLTRLLAAAVRMPEVDRGRISYLQIRLLGEHTELLKVKPQFAYLSRCFSHPEEEPPIEPDEQVGEAEDGISGNEPEEPGAEPRPQGA